MDWACCALFVPSEKQKELPILGSDKKLLFNKCLW